MGFWLKVLVRTLLCALALYLAQRFIPGFILSEGIQPLLVAAVVLALLNTFLRPILKLIATPLIWITFGLFHLAINFILLWVADQLLTQIAFQDTLSLFWVSLLVGIANTIL